MTRRFSGFTGVASLGRLLGVPLALAAITSAAVAGPGASPLDAAALKKQIAARKGKVVVVNFWATWCGPCVEEFPSLVKLYNANKTKGLDLITISCDEKRDAPKVNAFLAKNSLAAGIYQNPSAVDIGGFIKYLEPKTPDDASIGIPRTYIFDRNGKLVKSLVGGQSYADFQKAIAPYLTSKTAHK